jgi:hypothetical protein
MLKDAGATAEQIASHPHPFLRPSLSSGTNTLSSLWRTGSYLQAHSAAPHW